MSSDLRVALRIQAHAGDSRREIAQLNRDLHKAGKEGAKTLTTEAGNAGTALTQAGREGAASYKIIRQAMREAATEGNGVFRQGVRASYSDLREVGQAGAASYKIIRQAMREAATQGNGVFRQGVAQAAAELKHLGDVGKAAGQTTKSELAKAAREGADPLRQSVDRTETSLRRMAQSGGTQLRMLKSIAASVREEFNRIRALGTSAQGQLAGLGVGIGVASGLTGSAKLDRQLIRTQQTAGMSYEQRDEWRGEQWRLAKTYGVDREQVQTGFDTLIASGLSYDKAKASSEAIAQATAVTGADSGILAKALVTGASAFDIDLSKPTAAVDILQKMIVAGRLGNAELENLSSIFPKVGQDAKSAGMSMAQSLSFVETLSLIELEPDRLGTLAQSTLRAFNNGNYRKEVTKATGVQFFNKDKSVRNTQDVFVDLQRKYKGLKSDQARARFMDVVFGKMDQDTQKGVKAFLTGDRLENFAKSTGDINNAKGVIEKDLADNVSSATGTAGRMKATLGEAIDRMAGPLNKGFADFGSYLLDDLKLSGDQLLGGGIATGVGGYLAGRGLKAGGGALLNKFLGGPETLKNIAVGKVLEEAAGVTSVFVTNWPAPGTPSVNLPDTPAATKNGGSGVGVLPIGLLTIAAASTQLSGSSENTDEGRLRAAEQSKLLTPDQRTYYSAFYRNRMTLAQANPDATDAWVSDQSQRLTQQQTGLTAQGVAITRAQAWAQHVATAGLTQPAQGLTLLQQAQPGSSAVGVVPVTASEQPVSGPQRWASSTAARAAVTAQSESSPEASSRNAARAPADRTPTAQWAQGLARRLDPTALTSAASPVAPAPQGQGQLTVDALAEALRQHVAQLQALVGRPLVVEIRSDSDHIYADVERRVGIEARRGR